MSEGRRGHTARHPRRLKVLPPAAADIVRLGEDDPALELAANVYISLIEDGRLDGQELKDMPSYGDLSDCCKVYFAVNPAKKPTHRIVYQIVGVETSGAQRVEVVEVVAVEARGEGYVYLLASDRLGRLPLETQPRKKRIHLAVIEQRGATRKARRGQGPGSPSMG